MITLAIPTYRKFDLCQQCVDSALAGSMPPDRVIVVDNSAGQCPPIDGAEIIMGRQPQSVSKAWNDAVQLVAGDWLILANDDTCFGSESIAYMVQRAQEVPHAAVVTAIGFSMYLLRWAAYQAIGPFDEGFHPAYHEDNDYARRIALSGYWIDLNASHEGPTHGGSRTIATYRGHEIRQQQEDFRAGQRRYLAKWGGMPHEERYTVPWNGGPPR